MQIIRLIRKVMQSIGDILFLFITFLSQLKKETYLENR